MNKATAAAGSTVKVYDGSTLIGTVTADSTGAWTDVTPTLTNATHVFTATATTSAGTSAASTARLTRKVSRARAHRSKRSTRIGKPYAAQKPSFSR